MRTNKDVGFTLQSIPNGSTKHIAKGSLGDVRRFGLARGNKLRLVLRSVTKSGNLFSQVHGTRHFAFALLQGLFRRSQFSVMKHGFFVLFLFGLHFVHHLLLHERVGLVGNPQFTNVRFDGLGSKHDGKEDVWINVGHFHFGIFVLDNSIAVVLGTALFIRQDLVGVSELLEFLGRLGISWILVRVYQSCFLVISLFEFRIGSTGGHLEQIVIGSILDLAFFGRNGAAAQRTRLFLLELPLLVSNVLILRVHDIKVPFSLLLVPQHALFGIRHGLTGIGQSTSHLVSADANTGHGQCHGRGDSSGQSGKKSLDAGLLCSDNGLRNEIGGAGNGSLGHGFEAARQSGPSIFGFACTKECVKDLTFLEFLSVRACVQIVLLLLFVIVVGFVCVIFVAFGKRHPRIIIQNNPGQGKDRIVGVRNAQM
mmetsp:Transcript_28563/g.66893  ORF Transcript_28563/g.66893 Transcript_28563/m.66893 type:complete len:424 (+) Transcript_28563:812-2083(+)